MQLLWSFWHATPLRRIFWAGCGVETKNSTVLTAELAAHAGNLGGLDRAPIGITQQRRAYALLVMVLVHAPRQTSLC